MAIFEGKVASQQGIVPGPEVAEWPGNRETLAFRGDQVGIGPRRTPEGDHTSLGGRLQLLYHGVRDNSKLCHVTEETRNPNVPDEGPLGNRASANYRGEPRRSLRKFVIDSLVHVVGGCVGPELDTEVGSTGGEREAPPPGLSKPGFLFPCYFKLENRLIEFTSEICLH